MERRYTVPVEQTGWQLPGRESTVAFTWEYDQGRDRMLNLCQKGKDKQWDAQHRIDWSHDSDPADTSVAPDEAIPIFGSATWDRLSRAEKDQVRHHYMAWTNSQFLHGEQGALICSAKIVSTVPELESKFYAATQTMDKARHVETYARLLDDKLQLSYPINGSLRALLDQTISDSRWDSTYLGMQVMIEGVALAAFSMIRDFTGDPLARAEREEFVVEASYLLHDRFLAREVWDHLGFDADELCAYVDRHQMMAEFRRALFSRVVPTVKGIGLWGPKARAAFVDMGVMQFHDLDVQERSDSDERIAEEMEALLATRAEGRTPAPTADGEGSRAEELAETIADDDGPAPATR